MRRPLYSAQFKRDVRRIKKRRYDLDKLKTVLALLIAGKPLPASCRDHALTGQWRDFRDAHIAPDWLLIYKIISSPQGYEEKRLERTGTHADLFE